MLTSAGLWSSVTTPTVAVPLWVMRNRYAAFSEAERFRDTDEFWLSILRKPVETNDKHKLNLVTMAEYHQHQEPGYSDSYFGAHQIPKRIHGMVLDADRYPLSRTEIHQALQKHRYIAWSTYSSRPLAMRWRIIIPLLRPIKPEHYAARWDGINKMLGKTLDPRTRADTNYLGYLPGVHGIYEDTYQFVIHGAPVMP